MTYNPNIPMSTDLISDSQANLLTNFGQLDTVFGQDHIEYSAAVDRGKHKFSTYTDQVGTEPTPAANELAAYAATVGGITSLRYRKDNTTVAYTLNPIKAFAIFTANTGIGAQVITQQFNVASITANINRFDVVLSEAMQNGTTYAVFNHVLNQTIAIDRRITITSSTAFQLNSFANNGIYSFFVMEA